MKAWEAIQTYYQDTFPNAKAINSTGAATQDGTEYIAEQINNGMFGWMQAALNYAGLTPDGVIEADGTSQIIEAFQLGAALLPGLVMEWNLNLDPAAVGFRGLLLSGQGILRANYVELDTNNYVGDANNAAVAAAGGGYYHADNADGSSPNTAGIYLILPESRGYAPRGLDTAATVDPDGASRYLGDNQVDAFQGHIMGDVLAAYGETVGTGANVATSSTNLGTKSFNGGDATTPATDGVNGTPRITSETRMSNRSTKYVVIY